MSPLIHQSLVPETFVTVFLYHDSTITCVAGPLPMVSKGTHVIIPMVDQLEDECWEAKIVEQDGTTVKLSVNSPATAVCGLYGLTVTCGSAKGESTTTHNSSSNIVMLFNPWCEGKIGSGL